MTHPLLIDPSEAGGAKALYFVMADGLDAWLGGQSDPVAAWCKANAFTGQSSAVLPLPGDGGGLSGFLVGLGDGSDAHWAAGALPGLLPAGDYMMALGPGTPDHLTMWGPLAWALGGYKFTRYKAGNGNEVSRLVWPDGADRDHVLRIVEATTLTRDLINTPADHMGPDVLADSAAKLAAEHDADFSVTIGDDLIHENFPAIHTVGRAATVAPRLIDFTWGPADAPKVTLVGKGVCFDSGGLNIKTGSGMKIMKKDMGGAANVLGLASMVMAAKLPVRLRVLIPAVENAIAGNAFRPGDVVATRKGLGIEVGNTDAEGRVVLSDALTLACEENPALLVDCATLTGAARVALGPDLPAMFTDDDALAADLASASEATFDPLWRLPLWRPYKRFIESKIADINNSGDTPFAGAITAALFLKDFVTPDVPYAHLDLYAWNQEARPGRPQGGEAMAQRALFDVLQKRFG